MKKEVFSRTIASVLAALIVAMIWWIWGNLSTILWSVWVASTYPVSIPVWLLITAIGVLLLIGAGVTSRFNETQPRQTLEHNKFTEMDFWEFHWRWKWADDEPWDISPFCPSCDRFARFDEGRFPTRPHLTLFCTNCDHIVNDRPGTFQELKNDVTLEIEHAVRTGAWKQMVGTESQSA